MTGARLSLVGLCLSLTLAILAGCGGGSGGHDLSARPPASVNPASGIVVQTAQDESYSTFSIDAVSESHTVFTCIYGCTITLLKFQPASGKLCGASSSMGLFVSNSNGGGSRSVFSEESVSFPRWSSDGRKIAFSRGDALYVCNADGSELHQIPIGNLTDISGLCWSPGDGYIYFSANDGSDYDVYKVRLSGTQTLGDLVPDKAIDTSESDKYPDISPDGQAIVWKHAGSIYLMPRGGDPDTDAVQLTSPGLGYTDYCPRWSPDGRYVAFYRGTITGYAIYVYDTLTHEERQLTGFNMLGYKYPDWSPDGQYVYFVRWEGHLYRVLPTATSTSEAEMIQDSWGYYPDGWAPAGGRYRVLIGPDGSDWGGNDPPFGDSKRCAIIAVSSDGYKNAVSLYTGSSDVTMNDRTPESWSTTAVVEAIATQIRNIYQDRGPGIRRLNMSLEQDDSYPSRVLIIFDAESAQLTSVVPIFAEASSAAATSDVRITTDGDCLIIAGAPMTVIDPRSGRRLIPRLANQVVLDRAGRPVLK